MSVSMSCAAVLLMNRWCIICLCVQLPLIRQQPTPAGSKASSPVYKHRIAYVNQWHEPRTFCFRISNPELVRFQSDRVELGPGQTAQIVLLVATDPGAHASVQMQFASHNQSTTVPVYIIVTDDRGLAEETMLVHLHYVL